MNSNVDFGGARGSNTGDVYHELWAARSSLRLLDKKSGLSAVLVEGVPAVDGAGHQWDGVDCTLLFGGDNIQAAKRVSVQQLKYSASAPTKSWSPSRVCYGPSSSDPSSSLMRGLGKAFKEIVRLRPSRPLCDISIELVTNQPISNLIINAINDAIGKEVPSKYNANWMKGGSNLHRLVHASGLTPKEFRDFASCITFTNQTNSRFLLEEQMLKEISAWNQTEFSEVALRLRNFVRNRMMPEAAGEAITKNSVLLQFGVSDERALFPCPSEVVRISNLVPREISKEICQTILNGTQKICLHGSGGVGKSTITQELGDLLPAGSEVIVFDCYGAGSYMDASAMRHRSRDAFVQLSNELALRLNLPSFLEPKSGLDFARAFQTRLVLAAQALSATRPEAKLVIVIDAADNSVTAANSRTPKEESFVSEIASFENLPENVTFVVSARTGRLKELNLPDSFKPIVLLPFTRPETGKFVGHYWKASVDWMDDFHRLTNGTPRVQSYAFGKVAQPENAMEPLLPNGKSLDVIFEDQFNEAVKKLGQAAKIEETCAALTVLPRPIPLSEMASALNASEALVIDICGDLSPGIRMSDGAISLADEDFESFVFRKGQNLLPEMQPRVAKKMLADHKTNEYSALNVVPLLVKASLGKELLDLVENEPEPSARVVPDPILRMEIRNQRLKNAIGVCRSAENLERAMRFVLIGAEALETDDATRTILTEFPGLTARFAETTASRLILSNPDLVEEHGPLLLHMLSHDALRGNFSQMRENFRRAKAWFQRREDAFLDNESTHGYPSRWDISVEDLASILVARALEGGSESAISLFRNWPLELGAGAALTAVKRLIVANQFEVLQDAAAQLSPPLATFILVPLRLAGQPIDLKKLACGLSMLRRRSPITARSLDGYGGGQGQSERITSILLSGAEVLAAHNIQIDLVKQITHPMWLPEARRTDKLYDNQSRLIDGMLRAYCLHQMCLGKTVDTKKMLVDPPSEKVDEEGGEITRAETESERTVKSVIQHVAEFYRARTQILLQKREDKPTEKNELDLLKSFSRDHWQFDRNYRTQRLRTLMCESLIVLVAANTSTGLISKFGFEIRKGFWPQGETAVANFFSSLSAFKSLHSELLETATAAVADLARERMGARDKSRLLAQIAELVTPISPEDANVIFQKAIEVAHELDSEAMDQIHFLTVLVNSGGRELSSERKRYASLAAEFVIDAGIRLADVEHFPWDDALNCVSTLDFPTALACVARWDDSGYVNADQTLAATIRRGLANEDLGYAQAASLLCLVERPEKGLLAELIDNSRDASMGEKARLTEELARDLATSILDENSDIENQLLGFDGGVWLERLKGINLLKMGLESQVEPIEKPVIRKQLKSILTDTIWSQETLGSAKLLHPAAEELLKKSRENEEYISLSGILHHASSQVHVGDRVMFLTALVEMVVENDEPQLIDIIFRSISSWSFQLAVGTWCKQVLPTLIEDSLPNLISRYAGDEGKLREAITLSQLDEKSSREVILIGLEKNSEWLSSHQIFSLMQFLVKSLSNDEAASLLTWYLDRLVERIDDDDKESVDLATIPQSVSSAVAHFLVAYMSDVDLRLRWKAAHAGRRLARLGCSNELADAISLYDTKTNNAFRATGMPYYWLAARLWLMIMFDRISVESPAAVGQAGTQLLKIAIDQSFPHILVRDFAADACKKLHDAGACSFSAEEIVALSKVNVGIPTTGAEAEPTGSYDFFDVDRKTERFHFDTMDTLRYWYSPWLRVFEGATTENFLRVAESWIIDEWGVIDEKPYGSREPRKSRFDERSYQLSSNSHGSLPTLERYKMHLEWHAKWCAAGQFLAERPLKQSAYSDSDEFNELNYKISYGKLTKPPYWLADFVTNRPLEPHYWTKEHEDASEWLETIEDEIFLREIFPESESDWIVIDEYIDTQSERWDITSKISTGLVSPQTSMSLVRALQTSRNDMDFYVCPEGHNLEIDEAGFTLKGWVHLQDGDRQFDDKDPLQIGVGRPHHSPGKAATEFFSLTEVLDDGLKWIDPDTGEALFRLEMWGDKGADEQRRYLGESVVCSGHRLMVKKEALAKFLESQQLDLIADIGVTRRDKSNRKPNVFEETEGAATFERILLLKRSGDTVGAEQSYGSWRTYRSRT